MAAFATAEACDSNALLLANGELRALEPIFKIYGQRRAFSGPILTVKVFEDNVLVRQLLETRGDGRVLVIDGGGSNRCALLGGNLGQSAQAMGLDKEPMPMVRKRPRYESEKKAPKRGSKLVAQFQKDIALLPLAAFQKNITLSALAAVTHQIDHQVVHQALGHHLLECFICCNFTSQNIKTRIPKFSTRS
ncbi:hypothetical protein SLEP1_g37260 [Rubroshorea leprosula]|uniref:Uncharacterized protein n=1 Tax=Rubroshorea leprosula TaxID=152421 RepID=A0AAV5KU47_9ROSI|nr:hypothetical protein SLEP1_g37260 [Rubroshorea leprosula]